MAIPLLSVVIVQKFIYKEKVFPTLGLSVGKVRWYFVAMVIPMVFSIPFNGTMEQFLQMIIIGLTIATFSALIEEVAWRGFFRSELNNFSKFKTYFITALVWSIWHIPVAILYRYTDDLLFNTLLYCGQLFLFSFMISWLRDRSNSVITASIFHGMLNVFYF